MFNNKGQISETLTWVVATTTIIVILILSIFIVQFSLKKKSFDIQGGNSDLLVTKSFMGYLLSNDGSGMRVYDKLNNLVSSSSGVSREIVLSSTKLFPILYNSIEIKNGRDPRLIMWIGIVDKFDMFNPHLVTFASNLLSGSRSSLPQNLGNALIYIGVELDRNKIIELLINIRK